MAVFALGQADPEIETQRSGNVLAQRGAEPGGPLAAQPQQAIEHLRIDRFVEFLDALVMHPVAPIGPEAMYRARRAVAAGRR